MGGSGLGAVHFLPWGEGAQTLHMEVRSVPKHIGRSEMMFTDEQMFQLIKQLDDLKEKNVTTFEDVRKSLEFLLERQKGLEVKNPFLSAMIRDGINGFCPCCETFVGTSPRVPTYYCRQCGQKLIWPAYDEVKCDA